MFDLTGPDSQDIDQHPAKKRRLSPNVKAGGAPLRPQTLGGGRGISGTKNVSGAASKRPTYFDDDPIECSSSFRAPEKEASRELALDSDPFASSPQKAKGKTVSREIQDDYDPFADTPAPTKPMVKSSAAWDPISSSAPETSFRNSPAAAASRSFGRSKSDVINLDDSDGDAFSSDEEFPDLSNLDFSKRPQSFKPASRKPRASSKPKQASSSKPPAKSAEEKAREKEEKAAAREAEKERKLKEKQLEKEQKAADKARAAALAEVNKVRTDKKVSTPEMIVDLPDSLDDRVRLQAETLLSDLSVKHHSWDSPVDNVVKWRRRVNSRYDAEAGIYEPIIPVIEDEKHVMVILPAAEFVKLVLGSEGDDLESHVLNMTIHFASHTIIYLIEGLAPWQRKNRNNRNRQYAAAVRQASAVEDPNAPPPSSQAPSRKRKKAPAAPQEYIDEDAIEDALLTLQVAHGVLIHHTNVPVETAQWIAVFTQHISTIPYRRQKEQANDAAATFCMDTGQVRAGDGAADTYARMLQEVTRVTAPIAHGIAAEYPTVGQLVRGLEEKGPLVLEGVRKSANQNGAFTDRTVGQAMSRRIHKVFTGRDEGSTDI